MVDTDYNTCHYDKNLMESQNQGEEGLFRINLLYISTGPDLRDEEFII